MSRTLTANVVRTLSSRSPLVRAAVIPVFFGIALLPWNTARAVWDFGDAPSSYGTDPGAVGTYVGHQLPPPMVTPTLTIGPSVDIDCMNGAPGTCPPMSSANADRDDLTGIDDEDGITFPTGLDDASGQTYTVSAQVFDRENVGFLLCGWIDFDLSGTFDPAERICVTSENPVCEEVDELTGEYRCALEFNVQGGAPTETTFSRFRLWPIDSCPSENDVCAGPVGLTIGGEVEDHMIPAGVLPVSLNGFSSRRIGPMLRVEWNTASETFNVGFLLWGRVDGEWRMLTDPPIASQAPDSVTPRRYRHTVRSADVAVDSLEALALASLDTTGSEEWYGPFEIGEAYGEQTSPPVIDWGHVNRETSARLERLGLDANGTRIRPNGAERIDRLIDRLNRRTAAPPHSAAQRTTYPEVRVTVESPGMQRISYEDLVVAGVDLRGVPVDDIAVGYRDRGVVRVVRSRDRRFGPGDAILFWGERPQGEESLYIDQRVYWITVDPKRALDAIVVERSVNRPRDTHLAMVERDLPLRYMMTSPTGDPWVEQTLLSFGSSTSAEFVLDTGDIKPVPGEARLNLVLAGITDWPGGGDDHHLHVTMNGVLVADVWADGATRIDVAAEIPDGVIRAGQNTVQVTVVGDTGHAYDMVAVDSMTLEFPADLETRDGVVSFSDQAESRFDGFRVRGIGDDVIAFATSDGNLAELRPYRDTPRSRRARLVLGGQGDPAAGFIDIPRVAAGTADYWVSTSDGAARPALHLAGPGSALPAGADFLVLTHPVFLPDANEPDHPLHRYVAAREAQGWRVHVADIETIYRDHGWGMALPDAITRYLAAADSGNSYRHALLVGGDCYDYHDFLGSGCASFIPTRYASTAGVIHFAPSDGLLADLDGNGVADKAVGRWPVRTLDELESVVNKTLAWDRPDGGMRYANSAVWAADSRDPNQGSFVAQAERMIGKLRVRRADGTLETWDDDNVSRIYLDEFIETYPSGTVVDNARQQLVDAINAGRTITGFVGHGSPASWTFQNLFTPATATLLDNAEAPTQVVTLTCYTTYFVSPGTDTLAHRLLAGAGGGAVVVHGAATLSSYADNETMAGLTLDAQLLEGATVGDAILDARRRLHEGGGERYRDVITSWSLLGDPTLRIGE